MTFNKPKIPEKIKIGYHIKRVEQFIPNPLRCYKCQRYGHHEEKCSNQAVCGRCGEGDPHHTTDQCREVCKCANCGGDHPVYARVCEKWKKEKEILTLKHTKNISFLEARKIIEASRKEKTYSQVVKTTTNDTQQQENKYKELLQKLLQLGPEDWPRFIEEIKPKLELNSGDAKTNPAATARRPEISIQASQKHKKEPPSRCLIRLLTNLHHQFLGKDPHKQRLQ